MQPLVRLLNGETEERVSVLHQAVASARKQLGSSVEAGRQWVDSYVRFIVYAQGLYTAIQAGQSMELETSTLFYLVRVATLPLT